MLQFSSNHPTPVATTPQTLSSGGNPWRRRGDDASTDPRPEAGRRKPETRPQYNPFSPGGRVFHLRCTHSHCSGYFRT
jgi:hypothetical protein